MAAKQWRPGRRDRRVLLALLTGAPELSGYPLSRAAQVGSGRVYVSLAALEREGWVTSEWGPPGERGHRRRFYSLTPAGRIKALAALGLSLTTPRTTP